MTFARVKLFSLRRDVDENWRRVLPSPASPGVAGVAGQRPAAVAALAGAEPGRHDRHRRRVLPILRQRLSSELVSATSPQPMAGFKPWALGSIRSLITGRTKPIVGCQIKLRGSIIRFSGTILKRFKPWSLPLICPKFPNVGAFAVRLCR